MIEFFLYIIFAVFYFYMYKFYSFFDRFAETLMNEQVVLKMNTIDILNEIRSPALLELEASGDEIKYVRQHQGFKFKKQNFS